MFTEYIERCSYVCMYTLRIQTLFSWQSLFVRFPDFCCEFPLFIFFLSVRRDLICLNVLCGCVCVSRQFRLIQISRYIFCLGLPFHANLLTLDYSADCFVLERRVNDLPNYTAKFVYLCYAMSGRLSGWMVGASGR